MHRLAVAAYTASAGFGATAVVSTWSVIGQVAGGGAQVGDLISAGGSFSAAGALIYIVKKMTDGQLVSRDAGRVEAQQAQQIKEALDLVADGHERERKLEELYRQAITRNQEQSR